MLNNHLEQLLRWDVNIPSSKQRWSWSSNTELAMPSSFQCVLYVSLFKKPHMKLILEVVKKEDVKNARHKSEVCFRDLHQDFHQHYQLLNVLHLIFKSLIKLISSCIYSPSFFTCLWPTEIKKSTFLIENKSLKALISRKELLPIKSHTCLFFLTISHHKLF